MEGGEKFISMETYTNLMPKKHFLSVLEVDHIKQKQLSTYVHPTLMFHAKFH